MVLNNFYTKNILSLIAIGLSFFSHFNEASLQNYNAKIKTIGMLEKLNYSYINSFQSFNKDCMHSGTQLIKSNTYISGANELIILTDSNMRLNSFIWMEIQENAYCHTPFVRQNHRPLSKNEAIISKNIATKYQLTIGDEIRIESNLPNFQYHVVDIVESYYGHSLITVEQNRDGLIILGNNEEVINVITTSAKNLLIGFSDLGSSSSVLIKDSIQSIRYSTSLKESSYVMLIVPLWIIFSVFVSFNYSFGETLNFFFYGDFDLALAYRYKLGYSGNNIIWLFFKFEIPMLCILTFLMFFFFLMNEFSILRLVLLTFFGVIIPTLAIILIKKIIIVRLTR